VRHAAALGWRLDVNRATAADWQRLPGISPHQVDLLLRLQRGGVQLSGPDDLQRLLELPADQVAHHARVRWMTAGSEALLAAPPEMLVALRAAADAGDVQRVKGITDALLAGWDG
jgi:hypothetical protein